MGLTLGEIVAGIAKAVIEGRAAANSALLAIEALSPDIIKGAEEQIRVQLDEQLAALNVTVENLTAALNTAQEVLVSGSGPTKGGPDATLS